MLLRHAILGHAGSHPQIYSLRVSKSKLLPTFSMLGCNQHKLKDRCAQICCICFLYNNFIPALQTDLQYKYDKERLIRVAALEVASCLNQRFCDSVQCVCVCGTCIDLFLSQYVSYYADQQWWSSWLISGTDQYLIYVLKPLSLMFRITALNSTTQQIICTQWKIHQCTIFEFIHRCVTHGLLFPH